MRRVGGLTCVLIYVGFCPVWVGEELHNLVATNLEKLGVFARLILRVGSPVTAASSFAIHGRKTGNRKFNTAMRMPNRSTQQLHKLSNKKTEKKSSENYYVPRDEQFSATKSIEFRLNKLWQAVHAVIPTIVSITNPKMGFPFFTAIDSLYNQGLIIPSNGLLSTYLPRVVKFISFGKELLQYETPELITRDRFSWLTDKEFARETLAGINPYSIQLVKAVEKKRLFMLDYHDLFLPYVNLVRDLGDTYLYGSRTLFFLRDNGILQPIAIELTRPASNDQKLEPWKQVYTPTSEPTKEWLWKFAKLNVLVQDSAYHQLITHGEHSSTR
ncbi:hypothetical protein Syun_002255 [Stephania yunnanensis]|uniref:Lipoxygenase domain-containing protein n=1 Tax=Stephania yunnanensis TaxID=152371 RepID=A0AAP0LIA4_9MAGN